MATKSKKELVDIYVTSVFLYKITTPFSKWKAFSLGIIDKNGNQIKEPSSSVEKDAWGYFDKLAATIKQQLSKLPGGQQTTANFFVACKNLIKGSDPRKIETELKSYSSQAKNYLSNIQEDGVPVNSVGDASAMAGLGSNPPMRKKNTRLLKRVKKQIQLM